MGMFDQNNASQQPQEDTRTPEEILQALVGDEGKYKSPEELAKGYVNAEKFINQLKQENEDLRVKTQAAASVDDILARLKPEADDGKDKANQPPADTTPPEEGGKTLAEQVQAAVEATLAQRDQQAQEQTAQQNQAQVVQSLVAKYGDKASEVMEARSKELGMDLEELAGRSPKAVLDLMGVDKAPSNSATAPPMGGDHRPGNAQIPPEGTKAHTEYLYREGKISREKKYAMQRQYITADAALYKSQTTYTK